MDKPTPPPIPIQNAHTTRTRDAALRRLRRLNRWLIAGSAVLTGAFTAVAANAFSGRNVKANDATGTRHKASAPSTQSTTPLAPPARAPQASKTQTTPSQEAPAQESTAPTQETEPSQGSSAPAQESTPAEATAPAEETAPTQESAPSQEAPAPQVESGPVVSGGS